MDLPFTNMVSDYTKKQRILEVIASVGARESSERVIRDTSVLAISEHLDYSFPSCWVLSDEIAKEGYTKFHETVSRSGDDRLYYMTEHGRYFLENGGYTKARSQALLKSVWDYIKVTAVIANAITALTLAYFSYKAADVNNQIQLREQKKEDLKDLKDLLIELNNLSYKREKNSTKTSLNDSTQRSTRKN